MNDRARIKQLEELLHSKSAKVTYVKMGQRTMLCMIIESDGWETIGATHTQNPSNFDEEVGKRWALEDACNNLGKGRFWEVNILNA